MPGEVCQIANENNCSHERKTVCLCLLQQTDRTDTTMSAVKFFATLATGLSLVTTADADACNFGPTHHSHLVIPFDDSRELCKQEKASFFLSHGAAFFCPHAYDVKSNATIPDAAARELICDTYFDSLEKNVSAKVAFRPTLPAGGLPALAHGEMSSWESPVIYHVHAFGKDNSAGPDNGWNVTILRNETTQVSIENIMYSHQLAIEPKPAALTYLLYGTSSAGYGVVSHYISTSGSSGFDHLLKVKVSKLKSPPILEPLRQTWPLFLTIPGREDSIDHRLRHGESVTGIIHGYDAKTGAPELSHVFVEPYVDYYVGTSDGFAGFHTMCPADQPPKSPTVCV